MHSKSHVTIFMTDNNFSKCSRVAHFGLALLLICFASGVDGFTTYPSVVTPKLRTFGGDRRVCYDQIKNHHFAPLTQCSLKSSDFDKDTVISVVKQLWFLPVISLLSGLSPACRIISESHVSRLPDCPIAHDIDTRLLWPAIASSKNGLPPSIFHAPVGAITDESLYKVDWALVWNAYFLRVGISMSITVLIISCVIYYLSKGGDEYQSTIDSSSK